MLFKQEHERTMECEMKFNQLLHQQHRMQYPQQPRDYNTTLKQLLQATTEQVNSKTALSPNGSFKYIDRESTKFIQRKYNGYVKPNTISQDRVRRPLNCFMVFSHLERKRVAEQHPELHNADLSKILGKRWKDLSTVERQPYIDEAERIRVLHSEIYPDYKYQPRRKVQTKRLGSRKIDSGNQGTLQQEDRVTDPDDQFDTSKGNQVKVSDHVNIPKENSHSFMKQNKPNLPLDGNSVKDSCSQLSQQPKLISNFNTGQKRDSNPKFSSNTGRTFPNYSPLYNQINGDASSCYNYPNVPSNTTTPNLSPVSCYKEPAGNLPINSGMSSFPPTPEVSPTQRNREESVFNFDPTRYSNCGYYPQQMIKPLHHQRPIDLACNMNQNKENFIANYNYYTQVQVSSQIQYNNQDIQDHFQPNLTRPEFHQPEMYNFEYSINPNETHAMNNFENFVENYENF